MIEQNFSFTFQQSGSERLDKFLVQCLPDYSRSRLQGLIRDGRVTVDGKIPAKPGFELEAGMVILVRIPSQQPVELVAENIPIAVIYEDERLMVVNKPAGMVVHPAAGHAAGTLANAALGHAPEMEGIGGELRPGVVHRLDKDTSGLIVLAKDERTHNWLQDQFRLRKVKKVYLALVDGAPPTPSGRVEAAIARDPSHRKKMAIVTDARGRPAATEYFTLERFEAHTLLEAHPLTGRTHQIRLHLAFLGCPIVADLVYGRKKPTLPLTRHFLHAARLSFTLPGEKALSTFEAPLPEDLTAILSGLRNSS